MQIRPYQVEMQRQVRERWASGQKNVMMVLPTGGGKTHTKSDLIRQMGLTTCCIAHRQELVVQISESLASFGIFHNIIAPTEVVKFCVERHTRSFRRSYYAPGAPVAVAGVQTLLRRTDQLSKFISRVQLWDIDEAHHVLPENQWGRATQLFSNAIGLGVTATPLRCDRKALDGVFDDMVIGPTLRDLIDAGYLSDYRIFCPPVSIDLEAVRISGSTGEYIRDELIGAADRSEIVGDVVRHYLRIAPGMRGLTFAIDVRSAGKIADAYNAAGVPAAMVSDQTPDRVRVEILERLARGDLKQVVNVDLFGEGMDCPALEVVTMARPTQSYGLYVQQFGRVLRRFEGKDRGIVIDHVGNVVRHGLPDAPRDWSLAAPEGRRAAGPADPDNMPLTVCIACFRPYERVRVCCPWCGAVPMPVGRSLPSHVDGDLIELSPEVLAAMRAEVSRVDGSPQIPGTATAEIARAIQNNWFARQTAQNVLRDCISTWAGIRKYGRGDSDREILKRFYLTFGVDVVTAQGLGVRDAEALTEKIRLTMV